MSKMDTISLTPFPTTREHGFEAVPKWQNAKSKSRRRTQTASTSALATYRKRKKRQTKRSRPQGRDRLPGEWKHG